MTTNEFHQQIEDGLLEQRKKIESSKEYAAALIDFLGIRHLLVPMTEEEIKAAEEDKAAKKGIE
ncbi:hypothetical protein [Chitinophaga niabensis]|nr:hypothetical protein [Chitinophaga niabensis]